MTDRYLNYPFKFGAHGGLAVIGDAELHLRDKIEAVLFTTPGERVNQPNFGVGLNRAVFEPLDDIAVAAVEFRVLQALRRDVGDELIIDDVTVDSEAVAGTMVVRIAFRRRIDRKPRNLEVKL